MTKKTVIKKNKNEIVWNLVNSAIAGALIFFGAFTTGKINKESIVAAVGASFIAFCVQFRNYWMKEESEYKDKIFKFI